ncbi:hypothetical protein APT58_12750 [Corynebacterium glutamicum]|nr:hypothetical protein APT58_12750 [Corynebacterium glutamicum]
MGRFGAPNWERPDRRDKNLTSCELLARLSGLNHWKPDTRAKTLTFSPILSRLSGRFWSLQEMPDFKPRFCKKCPLRFASKPLKTPTPR